MRFLFWACLGLIGYTYVLYPALVMLLARMVSDKSEVDQKYFPRVTMVIPAYNEELVLQEKIANCLALDYPEDKLDFLFGSDASDDGTNEILTAVDNSRIRTIVFQERRGKSAVLNDLVSEASAEVILFSDANTFYQPDAVQKLVQHFTDPAVGGSCGKLELRNPSGAPGGEGEGLYWSYENKIKEAEGRLHSVISANAAIFAVRKELWEPLPTRIGINDDMLITIRILQKGRRVVYEPEAVAVENTSPDMESEFQRKIRIHSCNYPLIPEMVKLFKPSRGFSGWAMFSHKFLRWMVPFLGLGMLISNLILSPQGGIWPYLLVGQGAVYLGALLGYLADRLFENSGPLLPFYYLAMINLSLVVGLWRVLTKKQESAWDRVPR